MEGRPADYNNKTTARYHAASIDYFRAMGIPLLRGRFFTGRDDKDAPAVIVVNQTMAGTLLARRRCGRKADHF